MKTTGRFLSKTTEFLFLFLFLFLFPKPISAQPYHPDWPDLILTGFQTCWEAYDDLGNQKWKAWTWVKVKNQGLTNSGAFKVEVGYTEPPCGEFCEGPTINGTINFTSVPARETVTAQAWLPNTTNYSYVCWDANDVSGVLSSGYARRMCHSSTVALVIVDSDQQVDETDEDNNRSVPTFSAWPNSLVPGYPGISCTVGAPPATPTPKVYLNYEAEAGAITPPMFKIRDTSVSNCNFLHTPQGTASGKGYVAFNVEIPQTGYYVVFGRVNGVDWSSDSFYLSWDNGAGINWQIPHGWQWNKANNETIPKNWNLTKGKHTLKIRTREDGSQIDALVVTNNYNYQPDYFKTCQ